LSFFSFLCFRVENIIALVTNLYLFAKILTIIYILFFFLLFIFINNVIKVGKRRAYQLGLILRNRYNSFLGKVYYQPNIYAQSTEIVRTKMSLELVLAALYPPADMQKWNSLLFWQPVDFIYINMTYDTLLFPHKRPK